MIIKSKIMLINEKYDPILERKKMGLYYIKIKEIEIFGLDLSYTHKKSDAINLKS